MNILATNKLVTIAMVLGVLAIVYMTPNKSTKASLPAMDFSNLISTDTSNNTSNNTSNSKSNTAEPATMLLFGAGLVGFASVIRKKKN